MSAKSRFDRRKTVTHPVPWERIRPPGMVTSGPSSRGAAQTILTIAGGFIAICIAIGAVQAVFS